jgi:Ca2+-binding EF-hand superfamily protein
MRLLHNVGRVGDTVTSAFGKMAQEMTGGAKLFDSNSSLAIVAEALEKQRASEALAKRIWMSFVCEGNDALHLEDIMDVLGQDSREEADECFAFLDKDVNGDVSLDEMVSRTLAARIILCKMKFSQLHYAQSGRVLTNMLLADPDGS